MPLTFLPSSTRLRSTKRRFVLRNNLLAYYLDENSLSCKGEFLLTKECTVVPTDERPHSFKLITHDRILHVFATNDAERARWRGIHARRASSSARVSARRLPRAPSWRAGCRKPHAVLCAVS